MKTVICRGGPFDGKTIDQSTLNHTIKRLTFGGRDDSVIRTGIYKMSEGEVYTDWQGWDDGLD